MRKIKVLEYTRFFFQATVAGVPGLTARSMRADGVGGKISSVLSVIEGPEYPTVIRLQ